jgi:hypothetical protein
MNFNSANFNSPLKQCSKSLENPTDWTDLANMIEQFAKDGVENMPVEYVLKYEEEKKRLLSVFRQPYRQSNNMCDSNT